MKNLISIIIPVYNVENYLKKCLESIINQTYTNLEIILVDDGSTDNSGKICDEFLKKDKRVKVFHIENKGVSAARNYGFKKSSGEYIIFIDSDDVLDFNMIKILFKNIINYSAEISACGYAIFEINGNVYLKYGTKKIYNFNKKEALKSFFSETSFGVGVWNKLFKKGVISNLKFYEKLKVNEDRLFLFEAIMNSNKIIYDDQCLYKYIKRENSATTSKFSEKQFDVLKVNNLIQEKISNSLEDKEIINLCAINELIYLTRMYRLLSMSNAMKKYPQKKEEILKKMKYIIKNNDISKMNKFEKVEALLIIKFNFFYYYIMKILVNFKLLKKLKLKNQRKENMHEDSNINNTRQ